MVRATNSDIISIMPIQEKCRVISHQNIGPDHFRLGLASEYISSHAVPGQFVNIKCSSGFDPLLRRPFSLHRVQKERKLFEIFYEIKGKGTESLARYSIGDEVDVIGPLGEGFGIDTKKQIAILVGGGMGVAPLLALAEAIKRSAKSAIYVLIGSKSRGCLMCEDELKKITNEVLVATEDGTHGRKGIVSDLLNDLLNNTLSHQYYPNSTIYACGPRRMLKAVSEIAFQKKIECQVSLEERIACGIGACKGCAIPTKSGYKMVCKDGPVFNSEDIVW